MLGSGVPAYGIYTQQAGAIFENNTVLNIISGGGGICQGNCSANGSNSFGINVDPYSSSIATEYRFIQNTIAGVFAGSGSFGGTCGQAGFGGSAYGFWINSLGPIDLTLISNNVSRLGYFF